MIGISGVSGIQAVHLTQLQERVAALIGEIRTAIDQITTGHETWNTLEAGKPRIAHITQLRRIIDNL